MPLRTERPRTGPGGRDWFSITLVLGAVLLGYYLLALVALFVAQSPAAVIARLGDVDVLVAASNSVLASTASTVLSAVFGLPLAYWLARTEFRGRDVVTGVVVLPLVLPPIVSGMVLLTVVGPNAPIGTAASELGVRVTRSLLGVVLAQTFVASPFVVITAKAGFAGVDRRLEWASRSLGRDRLTTFRRVTFPLALPAIVAGLTLAFARAMGEFGATIMLAYYPRTMPVQIWVSYTTRGLTEAFPIAAILVVVSVVTIVVLEAAGSSPWK